MASEWIRGLLIAIATAAALAPPYAWTQERRQTYALPESVKPAAPDAVTAPAERPADTESSASGNRSDKPQVSSVRFMTWDNFSRVMIEVSQETRYEVHRLQPDPAKGLPPRIYVDVFGARLATGSKEPITVEDGIVRQIRVAQYAAETVRAVLEVNSNQDYSVSQLNDPYRIILDIRGQRPGQVVASVDRPAAAPSVAKPETPPVKPETALAKPPPTNVKPEPAVGKPPSVNPKADVASARPEATNAKPEEIAKPMSPPVKEIKPRAKDLNAPTAGLKKIVLDPGHGGKDPGAVGVHGVAEKDIVLKVAKKLAARLIKDLGVQVVLTRSDDRFIRLEDRTAIANKEDADLFISLHMNASPNGEAKGLETYYLDNTTDEASLRLAARENSTSTANVSDLQFILSDMTQNMKLEDSVTLAHRLHDSLLTAMAPKLGDVKDLGVKKALFYVLVGARMPSVLLEMFFITNRNEGRAMSQDTYQDTVVDALFEGIQKYGESVLTAKTL